MFHVKQILSLTFLLIVFLGKSQSALVFKESPVLSPAMDDKVVLTWNEQQGGYNKLSSSEKEFYYWVNYSRLNPGDFMEKIVRPLSKVYPQLKGGNLNSLETDLKSVTELTMFSLNDGLLSMAGSHAGNITSANAQPSHVSPNGEAFEERFKNFGLKNCGGENISYGSGEANPLFMLVMLYLDINVSNLGHRKALLNPQYVYTGISIKKYKNGNAFLVEDFACSQK